MAVEETEGSGKGGEADVVQIVALEVVMIILIDENLE